MLIKVGLTAGDLVSHRHKRITLTAVDDLKLEADGHYLTKLAGGYQVHVTASPVFAVSGDFDCTLKDRGELLFTPLNGGRFDLQVGSDSRPRMPYRGGLRVKRDGEVLRVTLECNLETYVEGVLDSEVPAYFQVEAMKAQAILARTYALRPRLSHAGDGFNVCDSYLHCQAFNGLRKLTGKQSLAIKATAGQILSFEGKPALALSVKSS